MSEVTHVLAAVERGDAHAAEQLLPLVYDELRKLAAARMAAEPPVGPPRGARSSPRRRTGRGRPPLAGRGQP